MLERTTTHHIVVSSVRRCLLAMALIYVASVVWTAHGLARPGPGVQRGQVIFGPLRLMAITKTPVPAGHQITLQLLPGMWVYAVMWLIGGVIMAWFRLRLARRSDKPPPLKVVG